MRVNVPETHYYAYPDVTVLCGEAEFADNQKDVRLNPTLIVEVLSPTTEKYDRGESFQQYRRLISLNEHVSIAPDEARVEIFTRGEAGIRSFSETSELKSEVPPAFDQMHPCARRNIR